MDLSLNRVRSSAHRSDHPADTVVEVVSRRPSYDGVVRVRTRRRSYSVVATKSSSRDVE